MRYFKDAITNQPEIHWGNWRLQVSTSASSPMLASKRFDGILCMMPWRWLVRIWYPKSSNTLSLCCGCCCGCCCCCCSCSCSCCCSCSWWDDSIYWMLPHFFTWVKTQTPPSIGCQNLKTWHKLKCHKQNNKQLFSQMFPLPTEPMSHNGWIINFSWGRSIHQLQVSDRIFEFYPTLRWTEFLGSCRSMGGFLPVTSKNMGRGQVGPPMGAL